MLEKIPTYFQNTHLSSTNQFQCYNKMPHTGGSLSSGIYFSEVKRCRLKVRMPADSMCAEKFDHYLFLMAERVRSALLLVKH